MINMVISIGGIMITETNAVSFRQNLGEILNQVQYRHDSVVINKDGKPVAALVDARLFERIRRMQGRFDALCQRIEAGFAEVPEADGIAEIEAVMANERKQRRSSARSAELLWRLCGWCSILTFFSRVSLIQPVYRARYWRLGGTVRWMCCSLITYWRNCGVCCLAWCTVMV